MKIIYYIPHSKRNDDGVIKKIRSQIKVWESNGATVTCLWHYKHNKNTDNIFEVNFNRFLFPFKLIKEINELKPDFIYLRYTSINLLLMYLLVKFKCIFEINGIAHSEKEATNIFHAKQFIKNLFHYISLKIIARLSHHSFSPTRELKELLGFSKCDVIPNSIDIEKFSVLRRNKTDTRMKLYFMGTNGFKWHGIHYIEKLARLIPEYIFHVVGSEGKNTNNLFYHGYLPKLAYEKILKDINICIGTMALHERGLLEASSLKVREYIANGFPIIINYKDGDEIMAKDWCLNLNIRSTEDLVHNIEKIKSFCEKNKDKIISNADRKLASSQEIEGLRYKKFQKALHL